MRTWAGTLVGAVALLTACQPIAAPLPRGARPAMLIEVGTGATSRNATVLRTFASGLTPSREVATDLDMVGDPIWLSWDIDGNASADLIRLHPDGTTLRLQAAQVWPPTGGLLVDQPTALPADDLPNRRFVALDIDRDHRVDLLTLHAVGAALTWRGATAAGGFASLTPEATVPLDSSGGRWWAAAVDANRDCRSDLAVATADSIGLVITTLDGSSGFGTVLSRTRVSGIDPAAVTGLLSSDDDLGGPPLLWVVGGPPAPAPAPAWATALSGEDAFAAPRLTVSLDDPRPGWDLIGPSNPPAGGAVETIPVAGRADQLDAGRGIIVHRCIADDVTALLAEASAAGFVFTGNGWRSGAEQAVLRRRHCGRAAPTARTEDCRPPTAPVGTSMHERGLAIDFRLGGRTIPSRAHPAFRWLAANAARFGLHNYAPEPWHWSTNGE